MTPVPPTGDVSVVKRSLFLMVMVVTCAFVDLDVPTAAGAVVRRSIGADVFFFLNESVFFGPMPGFLVVFGFVIDFCIECE